MIADTSGNTYYTFSSNLSLSTTYNENVVVVQTMLQNYYGYNLGSSGIDGIYGILTKNAVYNFQLLNGVTATGIVDLQTWNLLLQSTTKLYSSKAVSSETGTSLVTGFTGDRTGVISGGNIFSNIEILDSATTSMVSYVLKLGQGSSVRSITSFEGPLWMPLPVIPEQVTESVSANWDSISIPGRAASYYGYTGTSNRTVQFSLQFHNDLLEMYKWKESSVTYKDTDYNGLNMTRIVRFLESCCYPNYQSEKIIPPLVILKIGDQIKMRGFFNNVSITAQLPFRNVLLGNTNYKKYLMNSVSVSFTEVPACNPSSGYIYNYGRYKTNDALLNVNESNYEE